MFHHDQFKELSEGYKKLSESAKTHEEIRKFADLQKSNMDLFDNEEWLRNNYEHTLHASPAAPRGSLDEEEERVLTRLGATLLAMWDDVPREIQRSIFDMAVVRGPLDPTDDLRDRIRVFLARCSRRDG